jgi:hypothetical protein
MIRRELYALLPIAATLVEIDIHSRRLLWLETAQVAPERVATGLPPFVTAIREAGVQVRSITAPIADAHRRFRGRNQSLLVGNVSI